MCVCETHQNYNIVDILVWLFDFKGSLQSTRGRLFAMEGWGTAAFSRVRKKFEKQLSQLSTEEDEERKVLS